MDAYTTLEANTEVRGVDNVTRFVFVAPGDEVRDGVIVVVLGAFVTTEVLVIV